MIVHHHVRNVFGTASRHMAAYTARLVNALRFRQFTIVQRTAFAFRLVASHTRIVKALVISGLNAHVRIVTVDAREI